MSTTIAEEIKPAKVSTTLIDADRLGLALTLIGIAGACLPFVYDKANRLVAGDPVSLLAAMPSATLGALTLAALAATAIVSLYTARPAVQLLLAAVALVLLLGVLGLSATALIPHGNRFARVSPAAGFWLLAASLVLAITDALARLRPPPLARILILALTGLIAAAIFGSGILDNLSVMKEYAARADVFWREGGRHVLLALGSVAAAVAAGVPLGIFCFRHRKLRAAVLQVLNLVQTIPSIALFGLLMAPLGALVALWPFLGDLGIRGIGAAPALIALFLYALLPVVSNTVIGLQGVDAAVRGAALGMGMTRSQMLFGIEFPLALPVVLTGVRIVLVQSIGLVTIAALVGGGGFGVFVFQGVGQTAMDLVLLGAVPTVALAFAAAVILDALIDVMKRGRA